MNSQRRHRNLATLPPRIRLAQLRIRPPEKRADPVYVSPEWRAMIADIVARRGRRCEKCGKFQDAHGNPIRVFGDHIQELKDGGALLDSSNVELLCHSCHQKKTAAKRAVRTATRYQRG